MSCAKGEADDKLPERFCSLPLHDIHQLRALDMALSYACSNAPDIEEIFEDEGLSAEQLSDMWNTMREFTSLMIVTVEKREQYRQQVRDLLDQRTDT